MTAPVVASRSLTVPCLLTVKNIRPSRRTTGLHLLDHRLADRLAPRRVPQPMPVMYDEDGSAIGPEFDICNTRRDGAGFRSLAGVSRHPRAAPPVFSCDRWPAPPRASCRQGCTPGPGRSRPGEAAGRPRGRCWCPRTEPGRCSPRRPGSCRRAETPARQPSWCAAWAGIADARSPCPTAGPRRP